METGDKFLLVSNKFSSNIAETFKDVRSNDELVDVTLVCDDGETQAHKLVLFSGSRFFKSVLQKSNHQHPLLYMKGMKIHFLNGILDFLYNGEVNVAEEDLTEFLATTLDLQIKSMSENEVEEVAPKIRKVKNIMPDYDTLAQEINKFGDEICELEASASIELVILTGSIFGPASLATRPVKTKPG